MPGIWPMAVSQRCRMQEVNVICGLDCVYFMLFFDTIRNTVCEHYRAVCLFDGELLVVFLV